MRMRRPMTFACRFICACAISPTFQAWRGERPEREREDGGDREYVSASRAAGPTGRPNQLLQRRHEQLR